MKALVARTTNAKLQLRLVRCSIVSINPSALPVMTVLYQNMATAARKAIVVSVLMVRKVIIFFVLFTINVERNDLETRAKTVMTSAIRPDTLYLGTL